MKNRWQRIMAPEGGEGEGAPGQGTQQQAPAPSILGGQGGDKPWYDGLPPEYQTNPYIAQSKDLAGFVKSAIDTKAMVGANTIKLPGPNATEAEKTEFFTKLGRPAEPTAYTPSVQMAKADLVDSNVLGFIQTEMHKLGIPESAGKGLLDAYLGKMNEGYVAHEAARETAKNEGIAALKQEWGEAKFGNNVKAAALMVQKAFGPELAAKIEDALGNDVGFIKGMYGLAAQLMDDEALGGGDGSFTGSSMAAAQEIERLKVDKEFQDALQGATHAGHKAAVDRWLALHQQASAGEKK